MAKLGNPSGLWKRCGAPKVEALSEIKPRDYARLHFGFGLDPLVADRFRLPHGHDRLKVGPYQTLVDAGPQVVRQLERSVGVVRIRSEGLLEKHLLTPAIVRHLLIDWLGRPSEAKEVGPQLASLLARRCQVDADVTDS